MYQLYFDGLPLYDPRDDRYIVREPHVHLAVNEAGELSFTIDADHPIADLLTRLKGTVELRASGLPIFQGRIVRDVRNFHLSREITVEGLLACLNDSVILPFKFPEDFLGDAEYIAAVEANEEPRFLLGWLLDQHNSQVGPSQQIQLGVCNIPSPAGGLIIESSDYSTPLGVLRDKMQPILGGYLLTDYSSGLSPVVNYYADLPLTNVQEVEFGENLLDLLTELDNVDTYTAIMPFGADGLTIEGIDESYVTSIFAGEYHKSGRLVYHKALEEAIGGRIIRVATFDDIASAFALARRAVGVLAAEGARTTQTITVRAVDLGLLDEELPLFRVGRYVRLHSAPHGFDETYPLMEMDLDILDPGSTEITMGETTKSVTSLTHAAQAANATTQSQMQALLASQQRAIVAQQEAISQQQVLAAQAAAEVDSLPEIIRTQVTAAVQTSESIVYTALERYVETSNFHEFQQTIESQLSLLADELVLRFTEATDQTKAVDGDLQRTLETLAKYFEFGMDGLTIRAGENAMELTLDNDLVIFKRNGQQFGWWDGVDFHTGNIVIGVTERAQFGSFAFIPRENGLSFLEVGG